MGVIGTVPHPVSGYDQTFDEFTIRPFNREVIAGTRTVTASEMAKMHAAYDGTVAYMDDVVGRLLERFAGEPWYDQSLIIITADHGEQLGEQNRIEHGNGLDHGATSIPLIVKFPGQTTARDVHAPVSQVDVFSTIAAAAGVPVPGPRPGMDLGEGDPGEERSLIMESFPYQSRTRPNPEFDRMERAVVKGRWKLIASTRGRRDLYDMVSDPTETTNLAAGRADVARELEGLLQDWTTSAERQRPAPTPRSKRDSRLLQRLRALGYLQ